MMYEKKPTPANIVITATIFSRLLFAVMSPKPTVDSVVMLK